MTSETELEEYYLLVSENYQDWFRVPVNQFEKMFEPIDSSEECLTYQFNNENKKNKLYIR